LKRVEENHLNSLRVFSHAWLTILMPLTCSLGILYSFFHIDSSPAFFHHILTITESAPCSRQGYPRSSTLFALHLKHPLRDFGALLGFGATPWRASQAFSFTAVELARLCIPCLIYLCSNLRFRIKSGGPRDSTLSVGLVSLE
jgi:hypothetical protein